MKLSKSEFTKLEQRITEIDDALLLCDEKRDSDVKINLLTELRDIVARVQAHVDTCKKEHFTLRKVL